MNRMVGITLYLQLVALDPDTIHNENTDKSAIFLIFRLDSFIIIQNKYLQVNQEQGTMVNSQLLLYLLLYLYNM